MLIPEYEGEIPRLTQTQPEFDANNQSWLDYFLTLAPALNEFAGQLTTFSTTASSTTSNSIGTGNKTFTVEAGKSFFTGMSLRAVNDATNYMNGEVVSYSGTTLIINVKSFKGTGTFASWVIFQSQDSIISTEQYQDESITEPKLANDIFNSLTEVTFDPANDYAVISDASDGGNTKKASIPQIEFASEAEYITGTNTTKALNSDVVRKQNVVRGTRILTTSGTSHAINGLPTWATNILFQFSGLSTTGSSPPIFQIGDAGGIEATGYIGALVGTGGSALFNTGFSLISVSAASTVLHGFLHLTLIDPATNTWLAQGIANRSDSAQGAYFGGTKALSAQLDRALLTTIGGTDTSDGGILNWMAW